MFSLKNLTIKGGSSISIGCIDRGMTLKSGGKTYLLPDQFEMKHIPKDPKERHEALLRAGAVLLHPDAPTGEPR